MKVIKIVFKSGAVVKTPYSYKVYQELAENRGKEHTVDAKNFNTNTKNIDGIFFENRPDAEEKAAEEAAE